MTSFFWNEGAKTSELTNTSSKRSSIGSDTIQTSSPMKDGKIHKGDNSRSAGSANGASSNPLSSSGLQKAMTETLIEKIIKMALSPSSEMAVDNIENRMAAAKDRPSLSVQIMSRNFILMNSRLSLPFTVINEIIRIFDWKNPAYTISMIFLYTYIVLKPIPTVTAIPIFYLLFGVMVPEYLYIHKPNYSPLLKANPVPAQGPPLRKAEVPKPVPELSQEFVLNLTDLQNHLLIYVRIYDCIHSILVKFAFFVNEPISAFIYVLLLLFAIINIFTIESIIKFVPVKEILLVVGWSFAIIMHPKNREQVFTGIYSEETRLKLLTLTNKCESAIEKQLNYTEPREHRMVAIYEIQKFKRKEKGWVTIGYSSDDYTLFSDLRIKELKIEDNCIPLLEDVKAPISWDWIDNTTWALDLDPTEWLERGFIEYVDVDHDTKWVYDLNLDGTKGNYRRRMWTNVCIRKIEFDTEEEGKTSQKTDVNETIGNSKSLAVTRGSLSGSSDEPRPGMKTMASTSSLNSAISTSDSSHSVKPDASKAVTSLVTALNSP